MKIAFIGLGNMGTPVARNLLRAGHQLSLYNRTRSKAEALLKDGASVHASPAEAARGAEAVLTMLADDHAVEQVAFGKGGILDALPVGAIHVSLSTISVELSKKLAETHSRAGQGYVAAPVLGRPEAAENAKLWILPAGQAPLIERCRPLFDAIGQGTLPVSETPWQANVVKLASNFMIASMLEIIGEAYALARKSGISAHQLLELWNGSLFKAPIFQNYAKQIAEERYEPAGFAAKLGFKDMKLVLEAADSVAAPMPVASLVHDQFLAGIARCLGDKDWSMLAELAAERAGLQHNGRLAEASV